MPPPGFSEAADESTGGGRLQTLQPLSNELIATVLKEHDYTFHTDEDGDLVGKWNDNIIYFFRLGQASELLRIRTIVATVFPIDDVPALYAFCNEWNHDRLWPKAFVHVNDDGSARVCGDVVTDLASGVTAAQLDQILACGISTGCQLADAAAELRT